MLQNTRDEWNEHPLSGTPSGQEKLPSTSEPGLVGSPTTSSVWDVAAGLPVVLQDGTNTSVYGLGLISATDASGAPTYFLRDSLGSTVGLTNRSGSLIATYSYDVFGALREQSGVATDWLFTGQQRDSDSGLFYLRARHYDPATGRFLSRDPFRGWAGQPTSQNRYVYVGNNPTTFTSPSGLVAPVAMAALVWAAVEMGLTTNDAITTIQALADPSSSTNEKAVALWLADLTFPSSSQTAGDEPHSFAPGGSSGTKLKPTLTMRRIFNDAV